MLKQVDGRWALVSKKTQRPLAYYRSEGKPSDEWVKKQESRIQFFKHGQMNEAAYEGNIGAMEMFKFHQKASQEQKKQLQYHIKNKKHKEAWKLVQQVSGVKLIGKQFEEHGAGEDGTKELLNNYLRDTPGQVKPKVKKFKDYIK